MRKVTKHIYQFTINGMQQKEAPKSKNKILVGISSLLAISETLPFLTDLKSNGIIDTIKVGVEEAKKNL